MPSTRNTKKRLNRQQWLEQSLKALSKKGSSVLTIEALSRHLRVSRGSFYWHFKDRADFVGQLIDYWIESYSKSIGEYLDKLDMTADKKLLALMQRIVQDQLNKYDIPIRDWAVRDKQALSRLKRNDEYRYQYVRSLFAEIGFTGDELEMRTRTFVVFHSCEGGYLHSLSEEELSREIKLRHTMLTRRV